MKLQTLQKRMAYLDAFVNGYLGCALWSSNDESNEQGGDPMDSNYSISDIAPETREAAVKECASFVWKNRKALRLSGLMPGSAGHDFWLTRNGHGAGYWDRGLGDVGDALTDACKPYGEVNLYVGDDGRIYQ